LKFSFAPLRLCEQETSLGLAQLGLAADFPFIRLPRGSQRRKARLRTPKKLKFSFAPLRLCEQETSLGLAYISAFYALLWHTALSSPASKF
jgi:hypothetical protein